MLDTTTINAIKQLRGVLVSYCGTMDDVEILNYPLFVEKWETNTQYEAGKRVMYDDVMYKCIIAHTSTETWTPKDAHSLWGRVLADDDFVMEWTQPQQAEEAYKIGDKVIYNGNIYVSTIDNNVWNPSDYPAGWTLLESPQEDEEPEQPQPEPEPEPQEQEEPQVDEGVDPWVEGKLYAMADEVEFEGSIYRSAIDNNVWSPSAYPAGWIMV